VYLAESRLFSCPQTRGFTWFRNVQQEPMTVTAANCTARDQCTVTPSPICPLVKACPDGTVVNLVVSAPWRPNSEFVRGCGTMRRRRRICGHVLALLVCL